METAAPLETVENELHVFHRSHSAWKTRQKTAEFPTVSTALGKLGKRPPSFPQFPQPLLLDIVMKRNEERLPERSNQNRVDKRQMKA